MQFVETSLQGALQICFDPKKDNRGSFCRLFCSSMFQEAGIAESAFPQMNLSENTQKGTLRGMHFQAEPYLEAKIVYCLRGKVFDVIIDLRENSSTYGQHFGMYLSPTSSTALYIPKGFAHGFLTLEDHTHLLYLMSDHYQPGYERGYRYDDPAFQISWPLKPKVISERDLNHPPFEAHCVQT